MEDQTMTDKEKIKEDIKRRISNLEQLGDREHIKKYFAEQFRFIEVYEGLIKFIDSIPEESASDDLKKIEQKTIWNEDDEQNLLQAIYVCHQYEYFEVETWLKSIKNRIKQPK